MSCSVCAGYSSYNCPCCGEEVRMVDCPDCYNGHVYWAFDTIKREFTQTTPLAYSILPIDEDDAKYSGKRYCQGSVEICRTCMGEGMIPEEH